MKATALFVVHCTSYVLRTFIAVNINHITPVSECDGGCFTARHGTRCAGEVAAEANNGICSVGVAFESSIGGMSLCLDDMLSSSFLECV